MLRSEVACFLGVFDADRLSAVDTFLDDCDGCGLDGKGDMVREQVGRKYSMPSQCPGRWGLDPSEMFHAKLVACLR